MIDVSGSVREYVKGFVILFYKRREQKKEKSSFSFIQQIKIGIYYKFISNEVMNLKLKFCVDG